MTPVRACIRPYVQKLLTATSHSLLGGIDSNFQGLITTTDAYMRGKNEFLRLLSTRPRIT